jgi:rubrerythrin
MNKKRLTGAERVALEYGRLQVNKLRGQPVTCWKCGGVVADDPNVEKCQHCGADRVPF